MSLEGHGRHERRPAGPFAADGVLDAARLRYPRRLAREDGPSALDRLTGLAVRLVGSASAYVSLVEEVRTVLGGAGAAASSAGLPGSSAEALCAHVVATGAPVRIDDAAADERAVSLPQVTDGAVGSFLGVPLVVGDLVVGALCVLDRGPRRWTDEEVTLLESLAPSVAVELELAVLEADYEDDRVVWQLAVDAGGVGAFDWDLVTGELRWDERLLELFGLDRSTFGGTIEAFDAAVHPDDLDRVRRAMGRAIEGRGRYDAEYRVVLPGGEVRWIRAGGRVVAAPDGRPVRMLGAASDTTAAQEQEARVARVLESMPTAFFHLDRGWRFTYANGEAERLLGGIGRDIIGGELWELFPAAVGSMFEDRYRHAMDTGEPVTFEAYYPPPLDSWYEVRAWPSPDGLSVYFIDISTRQRAQEALAQATRRATLLSESAASLSGTLDIQEAVARLAQLIVPELGEWCIVTLVDTGDVSTDDWRRGLRDVGWWHADESLRPVVERYAALRVAALTDASFVGRALRGNGPVVVADDAATTVAAVLHEGEARDLCLRLDPGSAAVIPLRARGRTAGALTVFRDTGRPAFSEEDVAVLQQVAGRAGLALDNARLYREQRDLAEQLQRSMMTAPPEPDDLEIAVRYAPAAEAAQVGGDWYDAFVGPDGATVLVIGDVVGHDTASAAAMGQLRSILRGVAVTTQAPPAELLRQVDTAMETLCIDTTATLVVARLEQTEEERRAGLTRVRWSNAGHPPPLVAMPAADGPAEVLWGPQPNLLLGLKPDIPRDETVVALRRGATVLLYTDGLVERRGELIDEGIGRLAGVLGELVAEGVELEALCDRVLDRMMPDRPDDDVALVAVRLHPQDV